MGESRGEYKHKDKYIKWLDKAGLGQNCSELFYLSSDKILWMLLADMVPYN